MYRAEDGSDLRAQYIPESYSFFDLAGSGCESWGFWAVTPYESLHEAAIHKPVRLTHAREGAVQSSAAPRRQYKDEGGDGGRVGIA